MELSTIGSLIVEVGADERVGTLRDVSDLSDDAQGRDGDKPWRVDSLSPRIADVPHGVLAR